MYIFMLEVLVLKEEKDFLETSPVTSRYLSLVSQRASVPQMTFTSSLLGTSS